MGRSGGSRVATARAAEAASRARVRRPARAGVVALLLAAVHATLATLSFDPTPHTGGDNAHYVLLARSLLEGHGYTDLYDPATPPHTQYPPVFPAIIALALLAGLRPWVGIKLVVLGFSAAAVALTYLWLRRRGSARTAFWVALVVAVSPGVLNQSHWELSDVPFWAFTMLALWGLERARAARHAAGHAAGVAGTVLAYFTRSAGLPLALAAAGWLVLRRRWRAFAWLAVTFFPLAALWWLRAEAHGGVSYFQQFWWVNPYAPDLGRIGPADFFARILENDRRYLGDHLPVLLLGLEGRLLLPFGIALAVLATLGWAARLRRPGVAEFFLPLYAGLLLAWPPVWSGERFLLPILPILLANAGEALTRLARRIGPRAAHWAAPGAACLLLAAGLPALAAGVQIGTTCTRLYLRGEPYACLTQEWRDFFELAEWSRRALPDGAVVLSRKPRLFYVLSGHRGRNYPLSREPAAFVEAVRASGARYLVLDYTDQISGLYLAPILAARPSAFCVLRSLGSTRAALFGIRAEALAGGDWRVPPSGERTVTFDYCPESFWRPARR